MNSQINLSMIRQHPNCLANYYTKFNVSNKLLFTGHSHQAWPDCSIEGQIEAWDNAAMHVDDKWDNALKKAQEVREGFKTLLEDDNGYIALGSNTHELLVRFLSGLDFISRNQIITTDNEFHTVRRQLNRLEEDNHIKLITVQGLPVADVVDRIISHINDKTLAVVISSVYFNNGQIVENFFELLQTVEKFGAKLLIDVYHSLNVVPFSLREQKISNCFVIGGGYKYCQLGEGNAFLRFPEHCSMRPIITGWFSEWEYCSKSVNSVTVYGKKDALFAGSTYDPTSNYRGASVFKFFKEKNLKPQLLREISQHQIKKLIHGFDSIDADPKIIKRDNIPVNKIGGFLALTTPRAEEISTLLKERGVFTDYRDNKLRFGPAPYISDQQIHEAMKILKDIIHGM